MSGQNQKGPLKGYSINHFLIDNIMFLYSTVNTAACAIYVTQFALQVINII